jgi:hypothetical protein
MFMGFNIKKQIELLEKYGITDYTIKDGKLIINKSKTLSYLKTIEENFLNGVVVNGWLYLDSLTTVPEGFLQKTTVNGSLDLNSLITVPENFLQNVNVNGWLNLRSLTTVPEGFLQDTTVNGSLYLGLRAINSYKEIVEGVESSFNLLHLDNVEEAICLSNLCRINLKSTIEKYPNKEIIYFC